jgi:hypothetical protein
MPFCHSDRGANRRLGRLSALERMKQKSLILQKSSTSVATLGLVPETVHLATLHA